VFPYAIRPLKIREIAQQNRLSSPKQYGIRESPMSMHRLANHEVCPFTPADYPLRISYLSIKFLLNRVLLASNDCYNRNKTVVLAIQKNENVKLFRP
jgi:hypothetical protein